MEIIQEIGSYAGFAAVLGLAVLSALYFSQARDVKRLREWAGRAPDREPAPAVPAQRVVAQPVPRPPASVQRPGAPATAVSPGLAPATPAAGGAAAASAAGAAPATVTGPTVPTTPGQDTDTGDDDQDSEETDAVDAESNGTDEHGALSQDTVVHPPPSPLDEDDEDGGEEDPGTGDHDSTDADDDFEDDDYEEDAPERHWEDTGDEPAVTPPPAVPTRPTIPIGTGGAATPAGQAARPVTPSTSSGGGILPPYEQSRPGGRAKADDGGRFSRSPRQAVGLMAAGLVAIALIGFGVLQLTGGDDAKKTPSQPKSDNSGPNKNTDTPKKKKPSGVDPSKVRVAVLNGTTVPGLAAGVGDQIEKQGFQLGTVTNFVDQQRAESVVLYAPGAEREAADVGKRLKIAQREPIDAESQSVAGDATVVVITGADKTQ